MAIISASQAGVASSILAGRIARFIFYIKAINLCAGRLAVGSQS